jgi:hypothetical protein
MKLIAKTTGILILTLLLGSVSLASGMRGVDEARARVIHASPDAPAVDVVINDVLIPPPFENVPFGEITDYVTVPAGVYNAKVVPTGADSPVVINADLNLFYNTDYTVIALDTLAGMKISPLVLVDDNSPVSVKQARLRFVHASPDAPPVDVAVVGGPILFSNIEFKGVGDYVLVPEGIYELEVRLAGTDTVALSLPGIALDRGRTYTAVAAGFATGGSPALTALLSEDSFNPTGVGGGIVIDRDDKDESEEEDEDEGEEGGEDDIEERIQGFLERLRGRSLG